jgi:glycosyltransferase involved in cell wall biosynthesis
MKLLFVADGRSPIALNWIKYFVETGHKVHLVSTFPCNPDLNLSSLNVLPIAFASATGDQLGSSNTKARLRNLLPVKTRTALRHRLGPYKLYKLAPQLRSIVEKVNPDLVHAMRVPYEGMLAALANITFPLLISVWGNDFTLHAVSTRQMGNLTRQALRRADALHTDCQRDLRLAPLWGFVAERPSIVLPGAGGIQRDVFYPLPQSKIHERDQVSAKVINPRGFRAYVRNESFFHAIPLILAQKPETKFICPAMANEKKAQYWVNDLKLTDSVSLLPRQSRSQMASLYRQATVAVSLTIHDGTPNSLLEAMSCGCLPIAGDIESLREWITPGVNGLLVDPDDPKDIARAILTGLDEEDFRERARGQNLHLITDYADYNQVMAKAEAFYQSLINSTM